MECMEDLDPEDIFASSLGSLYDYQPITLESSGSVYTYTSRHPTSHTSQDGDLISGPIQISLTTPDTLAANWFLHASDIWASSLYLADHLDALGLDEHIDNPLGEKLRILELGAAAGLPGILLAKTYKHIFVTVSDYPDERLIETLSKNVIRNGVSNSCKTVPYAWGTDARSLNGDGVGFDFVIAADTLWNSALHAPFIETLQMTLKKSPFSRAHLVAGLHTGRYTIQHFIHAAQKAGFDIENVMEKAVIGEEERVWEVSKEDEEADKEKRRWVVWIIIKWPISELDPCP